LSKLIKPSDKELFNSVKKFEKASLNIGQESAKKESATVNPAPSPKREPPARNNPKQPNPEDLIAQAERKAGQIVHDAEKQADRIREEAHKQGYSEGLLKTQDEAREQLQLSSRMIDSLVAQIKTQESQLMQMLTPRLANLATELAQKILHREIEKDPSVVTLQAQEAINRILEREKLIIRVNPADEELMKNHKPALMKMFDGIDKIEVVGDPKVERGGCIVETHLVKVDAQPSSQLEAAKKTLLGGTEK
jgi:flagellar biosynthesis/type III secretory pathway protein FliH